MMVLVTVSRRSNLRISTTGRRLSNRLCWQCCNGGDGIKKKQQPEVLSPFVPLPTEESVIQLLCRDGQHGSVSFHLQYCCSWQSQQSPPRNVTTCLRISLMVWKNKKRLLSHCSYYAQERKEDQRRTMKVRNNVCLPHWNFFLKLMFVVSTVA